MEELINDLACFVSGLPEDKIEEFKNDLLPRIAKFASEASMYSELKKTVEDITKQTSI